MIFYNTCICMYLHVCAHVCLYKVLPIYNSENVANLWVEKKQGLSSSTLLIIREWKIIIQIYMIKNSRQFDTFLQN